MNPPSLNANLLAKRAATTQDGGRRRANPPSLNANLLTGRAAMAGDGGRTRRHRTRTCSQGGREPTVVERQLVREEGDNNIRRRAMTDEPTVIEHELVREESGTAH